MTDEHESAAASGFEDDEGTMVVGLDAALAIDLEEQSGDAYLTVISGHRVGEMVKLSPGDLVIGRGLAAGFRINDAGTSKEHVRVTLREDGKVTLTDLGSRNGTRVNGERVAGVVLEEGDKIHVGAATVFKFAYADAIDETFQQQMYEAALRDTLTGLFNRRLLAEQLEIEYKYSERSGDPLSFMMFDIDHFKQVNDTHGHPVGDTVLHSVAQRLLGAIRREDLAARYGGEEFALLCRKTPVRMAYAVAERLRGMLECAPVAPEIPGLRITVSIGVAGTPNPSIASGPQLIEAADKALYAAKASGRNRVCAHYDLPEGSRR